VERGSFIKIDNENIKILIQKKAEELGFFKTGFAKAIVDNSTSDNFNLWLQNDYQADMGWLLRNSEKIINPELVLKDIKTVIVFAYSYNTGIIHQSEKHKISRYAWGDDYHDIILPKLNDIINIIKTILPESNAKAYVDSGPVLEKFWAEKAGIGWQGKNSLIINKEYGSYFFLGVILTDIAFEESPKYDNYCGKCSKCIDSCPTSAILNNKVLDSNKCISYWNIESKDNQFPLSVKDHLNKWAFGCDICQEVCPWNKKAINVIKPEFLPRNNETNFNSDEVQNLSEEAFRLKYKNSPIKRRKLKGILKNIGSE
jgi:epoxyqueuosine reductase